MSVFLSNGASRRRQREAEAARRNRLEIVKARALGDITRRDLVRWGIFGAGGLLVAKNGLSPFARSAFADVPTGTPRSPVGGVPKFSMPLPRAVLQKPIALDPIGNDVRFRTGAPGFERDARKSSYHTEFTSSGGASSRNTVTNQGPCEGRPPGDYFAHQRWEELKPKVGYLLSIGQVKAGSRFHPNLPVQNPNSVWGFGARTPGLVGNIDGTRTAGLAPVLIKGRYGEPILTRIYNDLPVDRSQNGGFGRNELSTHFHNAHNGAESDGASNAYHFPGTFYDYHWSTALARRDNPGLWLTSDAKYQQKASGPDNGTGLVRVPGDFRELQGSMWFHDHRFFFTAENVHKGMFALCNYYSGPDRGRETLADGINLMLPSGSQLPWGNTDFDVNLAISNPAFDPDGQLFFDIFDTDGFLGDVLAVNGAYYPFMEVLPRRYRLRFLNASMARFIKLALLVNQSSRFSRGTRVPFHFIANDGNFTVKPIRLTELDEQGVAERYDIVVDFSAFRPGDTIYLTNLLKQIDGRKPEGKVSDSNALAGDAEDPAVGPIMQFRVVSSLRSVDNPSKVYTWPRDRDLSANLDTAAWGQNGASVLTKQIPIVAPVRVREFEYVRFEDERGDGDSRDPLTGECIPDCGDIEKFPWAIKVNGQLSHTLNANRISAMIPKPGEVEHWTLVNNNGGWDHPIHLHFEEGVTIDRGGGGIPATERLVRKDVWRLRRNGSVKFQVRFGEFGGAYVNHCHNTTHEDFAMLLRLQLLTPPPGDPAFKGSPQYVPTLTPIPTPNGVVWKTPEILPEADPNFVRPPGSEHA